MSAEKQKYLFRPPQSYWLSSTSQTDYPVLSDDIQADVAIIGGGITGIATAYLLSQQGVKAVILEANHILQGTTGHTTAKITSQHGLIYNRLKTQLGQELAQQYAEANESAIRLIEQIARNNQIECDFKPESAYIFTEREGYVSQIEDEVQAATSLGIKASYCEEIPLPFPVKAAMRFDGQAQFHPRKFLLPLADRLKSAGIQIFEQTRIVDIEEKQHYVLTTHQGFKITADTVIIASHYPFYNKADFYFSRIFTERSYVIAVKAREQFPGGMYINAESPTRSLRSQVYEDRELILIGGEHHKTGQGIDTIKHYENLIDYALANFTVEDIPFRWSTQDCMTVDGLPYVGHFTANRPNMYIATGYGKWGMTNSFAAAMILRDLIISGESPWQEVYNPARKTLAASASTFISQNLNVARNLIGGKIAPLPLERDIKPAEGKIIEVNGQRAGAYRDTQGQLHIVNTTCTHMGCELNWNSAESSWDCPCHGSRFTYTGEIIDGPAVHPLDMQKDVNTIGKLLTEDF